MAFHPWWLVRVISFGPSSFAAASSSFPFVAAPTTHAHTPGEVVSEIAASYTLAARIEGINVLPMHRPDLPDVLLITTRPAKV